MTPLYPTEQNAALVFALEQALEKARATTLRSAALITIDTEGRVVVTTLAGRQIVDLARQRRMARRRRMAGR